MPATARWPRCGPAGVRFASEVALRRSETHLEVLQKQVHARFAVRARDAQPGGTEEELGRF